MKEASAEEVVIKPLPPQSCPFLLIDISTSQAQHGLRHGDYGRYRFVAIMRTVRNAPFLSRCAFCRQYCTNRLRRLSKALKFSHGTKTRYVPRKLQPQDVTDPRYERTENPRKRILEARGMMHCCPSAHAGTC